MPQASATGPGAVAGAAEDLRTAGSLAFVLRYDFRQGVFRSGADVGKHGHRSSAAAAGDFGAVEAGALALSHQRDEKIAFLGAEHRVHGVGLMRGIHQMAGAIERAAVTLGIGSKRGLLKKGDEAFDAAGLKNVMIGGVTNRIIDRGIHRRCAVDRRAIAIEELLSANRLGYARTEDGLVVVAIQVREVPGIGSPVSSRPAATPICAWFRE